MPNEPELGAAAKPDRFTEAEWREWASRVGPVLLEAEMIARQAKGRINGGDHWRLVAACRTAMHNLEATKPCPENRRARSERLKASREKKRRAAREAAISDPASTWGQAHWAWWRDFVVEHADRIAMLLDDATGLKATKDFDVDSHLRFAISAITQVKKVAARIALEGERSRNNKPPSKAGK